LSSFGGCDRDSLGHSASVDFILGANKVDVSDQIFVVVGGEGEEQSFEQAGHELACENKWKIGEVLAFWHPEARSATWCGSREDGLGADQFDVGCGVNRIAGRFEP
jgi:hypothetical protein